jgi:hypothetical protein
MDITWVSECVSCNLISLWLWVIGCGTVCCYLVYKLLWSCLLSKTVIKIKTNLVLLVLQTLFVRLICYLFEAFTWLALDTNSALGCLRRVCVWAILPTFRRWVLPPSSGSKYIWRASFILLLSAKSRAEAVFLLVTEFLVTRVLFYTVYLCTVILMTICTTFIDNMSVITS